VFCHRFYALNSHTKAENDWQQVSAACLFLAGKVEETPKALRDVVSMAYLLRHRKEQEKAQEAVKNKARPARGRALGCAAQRGRSAALGRSRVSLRCARPRRASAARGRHAPQPPRGRPGRAARRPARAIAAWRLPWRARR